MHKVDGYGIVVSKNVRVMDGRELILRDFGVEDKDKEKGKSAVNRSGHDDKLQLKMWKEC